MHAVKRRPTYAFRSNNRRTIEGKKGFAEEQNNTHTHTRKMLGGDRE